MKCPFCGDIEDKVIDSRQSPEGDAIRRRRECLKCQRRFTTYEHVEKSSAMILKKDGRREPFDKNKVLSGIVKACEKRPVSMEKMQQMVDEVERSLENKYEKEIPSKEIGEVIMRELQKIDDVAYVRFASVYREFKDVNQFMSELSHLLKNNHK
ncbi:MAG: transcriptional regulator NrdR [Candidatus Omnitrophica bacterium CG12_big_fil_rev_8_21_14_0_65_43_15]|uniref:Transcriptional repressor NrdR n=1 Tax=Candidatus Taenaricola geysiri TaxID=1974752 RepID=A0A2J0LII5_9BACT|nr:MAG: transcriptional regulator NrdR [Candidatus Omnitrophica bacterium CG1_02_43_210]PIV11556.1 MAG: transcriptional regulator NrdR [Candidatus Omnitrophica bacterium CG03_land_8_20_14_0_80_43_22]PIW66664.1 MAG: transcriptional regulator NrdR [Candidatus Omnitrophica bacterium CG12_big_fil_rev_8_21_14_0_65_43_15]PIW80389.1 MAG: transcriptional regulator NrdR [Candidatus Omnitrophica bacterium CG_4_8_14_3_um_filter_43_15]PIY84434.1 MAG: transcriptional regulator NrdR [Candidatus Omnitrophica 